MADAFPSIVQTFFTYESVKHLLFICPKQIEQFGGGEPDSLWLSSPSISLSEIAMSVINCFWMKSRIRVFVFIGGVGQLFKCSGVGGKFNVSSDIVVCTNILLENLSHTKCCYLRKKKLKEKMELVHTLSAKHLFFRRVFYESMLIRTMFTNFIVTYERRTKFLL